jgi:hypothetical protein
LAPLLNRDETLCGIPVKKWLVSCTGSIRCGGDGKIDIIQNVDTYLRKKYLEINYYICYHNYENNFQKY